jgi:predicted nucleic acid-binding protein
LSGYLLDTNIISGLAPDRPPVSGVFAEWMDRQGESGDLFISAVVVMEIRKSIASLRRRGGGQRADRMDVWLAAIVNVFGDRILPVDVNVGLIAGEMADLATATGRHPGLSDILIAATANAHGLTVVTRNIKHFEPLNVLFESPAGDV